MHCCYQKSISRPHFFYLLLRSPKLPRKSVVHSWHYWSSSLLGTVLATRHPTGCVSTITWFAAAGRATHCGATIYNMHVGFVSHLLAEHAVQESSLPGQPPVWTDFPEVSQKISMPACCTFIGGPPVLSSSCLSVLWAVTRESFNYICCIFPCCGWLSSGSNIFLWLAQVHPPCADLLNRSCTGRDPTFPVHCGFICYQKCKVQSLKHRDTENVPMWCISLLKFCQIYCSKCLFCLLGPWRTQGLSPSCQPLTVCGLMGSTSGRISIKFIWLNTFYWGS